MKTMKVEINDFGGAPICEHNVPCAIHYMSKPAVLTVRGEFSTFDPSWKAQEEGWALIKADTWFKRFILKTFLK